MSDLNRDVGHDARESGTLGAADGSRHTIPQPADEELVYRVDDRTEVVGAGRRKFDVPATIAGALAALGTLLVLSSILGALGGTIGFDSGLDGNDLALGSIIGALVALLISCVVGGWVAGRIARHHEAKHGLVSPLWLILLAAVLAGLAALVGDEFNVTERVGLPNWFSRDTLEVGAIVTGLAALALMLLGGWLGGKLAGRQHEHASVALVETKRAVRERPGGIVRGRNGA
jgi:MFS family permease